MDWLINLFTNTDSVAHIALLYAVVIATGVYLGKIKIGGISLGVTFRSDTVRLYDWTSGWTWFLFQFQGRRCHS